MTGRINSTVPVLASLAMAESVAFYARLGFTRVLQTEDYLILERDGAELHFWRCDERHIAENTSCYMRVTNTQALYEAFAAAGVTLNPPQVRAWGMRELYVIDPHGNLLKFGEPVAGSTSAPTGSPPTP